MIKFGTFLFTGLLAAALPVAAIAQSATDRARASDNTFILPQAGTREITLGGNGTSNKDFDSSAGGAVVSFGQYLNSNTEILLRQTVNYANPPTSGAQWNGATKIAVDQNFSDSRLRPFAGVNFGGLYGQNVRDTWAAGLEGGVKYYVLPRTFVAAAVEYGWLFRHAHNIDDQFDKGAWNWSVGLGFNF